jgi:Xaa-Pro aminopeptidase
MITARTYADRRTGVLDAIGHGAALVLAASPELIMGHDTELKYVIDPDLWYLTGYGEPEAVLVLRPSGSEPVFTLFVRPRDPERETWTGRRTGTDGARTLFGADDARPIAELGEHLAKLLSDVDTVYARLDAGRPDVEAVVSRALRTARRARPRTGRGPFVLIDPGSVLAEMRLFKEAAEVQAIREAARVTTESFVDAIRHVRDGAGEWEIEAALDGGFRCRGAAGPAFPTIVASGPNATVLHHVANDRIMHAGDLVLVDAGARCAMYCADITRTVPVSGRFEGARLAVYEIVLAAHDAAIAAVRPGATLSDVHAAAQRVLVEGMVALKLVTGDVDGLIEQATPLKAWYPHKTSHWLGLDVHDVGHYVAHGGPRVLEPGMVFTIEPGLYVPADAADAPDALRGIGVRIEDDVLVRLDGREVLTAGLPVRPADVAAMVN